MLHETVTLLAFNNDLLDHIQRQSQTVDLIWHFRHFIKFYCHGDLTLRLKLGRQLGQVASVNEL